MVVTMLISRDQIDRCTFRMRNIANFRSHLAGILHFQFCWMPYLVSWAIPFLNFDILRCYFCCARTVFARFSGSWERNELASKIISNLSNRVNGILPEYDSFVWDPLFIVYFHIELHTHTHTQSTESASGSSTTMHGVPNSIKIWCR